MGSGIAIECDNCGYKFEAITGVGMMYSSLSKVLFAVHYKRRPFIEDILDHHDVDETEYEHRVYKCSGCGKFAGRFYVKILYDQGSVYESEFKCSKCKKELADVSDEDLTKYQCPQCNNKSLMEFPMLMWD